LFGVPVPEEFSADGQKIETEIQAALRECTERNIHGKDVTPFVLARLNELTQGTIFQIAFKGFLKKVSSKRLQ
jgi:pseudouridine-5'-phosphate glycosidase